MNISNSAQIPTQLANRVSGINNQQPVQRIEREREQNSEQEPAKTTHTERFDVDQASLAVIEQAYQNSQANSNKSQNTAQQATDYDTPSEQNQSAISAYERVDNLAQKESVQQLFGVDLYA
ncbi:MAG: hypothetical protein ACSHW0_06815 [Thalassotalea sp.]